ncbi:MAG TPA: hypothetical protein VIX89_01220 [Bryobacteraceae bacterium]
MVLEKRASLIVFIGNDGAGKTTQATLLFDWLLTRGQGATLHPTQSLQPIKSALTAMAQDMGRSGPEDLLGLEESQFVYAVLKWNKMMEVRGALSRDDHFVVMDRYAYCHIASVLSQGLSNAALIERLFAIFPRPDVTFYIDVTPETALARIQNRKKDLAPMTLAYLTNHARAYRELKDAPWFVFVDGERSMDDVAGEIREHMRARFHWLK